MSADSDCTHQSTKSSTARKKRAFRHRYGGGVKKLILFTCIFLLCFLLLKPWLETSQDHPYVQRIFEPDYKTACANLTIFVRTRDVESRLRQIARDSWITRFKCMARNQRILVNVVFVAGYNSKDNRVLALESGRFEDILQFELPSDYLSITYRQFQLFEWHHAQQKADCPKSHRSAIMWINSDVLISAKQLVHFMLVNDVLGTDNTMYGQCSWKQKADRDGKYILPRHHFPPRYYPPYLLGFAIIASPGCVEALLPALREFQPMQLYEFLMEDVLFTSLLPTRVNVSMQCSDDSFKQLEALSDYDQLADASSFVALHLNLDLRTKAIKLAADTLSNWTSLIYRDNFCNRPLYKYQYSLVNGL